MRPLLRHAGYASKHEICTNSLVWSELWRKSCYEDGLRLQYEERMAVVVFFKDFGVKNSE